MKKHLFSAMALLLMLGSFASLQGQAVRNSVERAQDRNQIQNGKEIIQRDRGEIRQFVANKQGMYAAIEDGKPGLAKGYHAKLISGMEREIEQGKAKIAQSNREVTQSRSEVRSSNREVRNTRGTGKPVATADDRRDRRDDQRDLQDDKADRAELIRRNTRQKEILSVFRAVKVDGPGDYASIKAKRNLLDEFEQTMIRDMGENWEELSEDKQELREDRRETREDRRQR